MNSRAIAALTVLVCSAACRPAPDAAPPAAVAAPNTPPASAVPHGDHNPHHGGVVMMKDDMHYELVVDGAGRVQLFFTDAVREDLPASIASAASVTLRRNGSADEPIRLQIDPNGESWIGAGRPVADRANTTAHVSFTIRNEPYAIDLPIAAPSR
jgi:hypothetical protein